jgi:glycosyltransferase involved in cell wall biosynthesis
MSGALSREFGCRPPTVIYNAFAWAERRGLDHAAKERRDRRLPSIHWFSQTLGTGRGLEDLVAALPHLRSPAEIHLRGQPVAGFVESVRSQLPPPWSGRVFFHPLVRNEELLPRIAEHDIGFAGEQTYCRSRDLTVTNKILQYLLGGLAVVASDTAGQREVAAQAPGAVFLYRPGDCATLAEHLNRLLGSVERLATAKAAGLRAAERTFCWERQVPRLVDSVRAALAGS